MAQDEEVEQEMLVVEEEQIFPPQMDPEPEMGAAAAEAPGRGRGPTPERWAGGPCPIRGGPRGAFSPRAPPH